MASRDDGTVRITSAPQDPRHEIAARQRAYVISMSIRLVCLFVAVYLAPHWGMWVALLGAVFLPYVAVVGANAKDLRKDDFAVDRVDPQWQLPPATRTSLPRTEEESG